MILLLLLPFLLLVQPVQSLFIGSNKNCPSSARIKSRFTATYSSTLDYLELVREGIQEGGQEDEWDEATQILMESTLLSQQDAQDCLARALNWRNWALCKSKIAKRYIKPKPPNAQSLKVSLDWLKGDPLFLTDPDKLQMAILSNPEPYLLSPKESYQKALQVAPSKYKHDPLDFIRFVLANPYALGCVYNCVNDGCNSECGSCWVSYENRASLARDVPFDG
jgi:hypothetical protein